MILCFLRFERFKYVLYILVWLNCFLGNYYVSSITNNFLISFQDAFWRYDSWDGYAGIEIRLRFFVCREELRFDWVILLFHSLVFSGLRHSKFILDQIADYLSFGRMKCSRLAFWVRLHNLFLINFIFPIKYYHKY